jgi:drug/metabolite transporter (DMT)-like permease
MHPTDATGKRSTTSASVGHHAQRWLTQRTAHLSPTAHGLLWAAGSGVLFCTLNATMRGLAQQLPPPQAQFLRYLFGFIVMLPLLLRDGAAAYWPRQVGGQFTRGAVHTLGLMLWFMALPRIPLAATTAIGFTTPLFIMVGAFLFLREPMRWERWLATALGFAGVLIVVGPKLAGSGGGYHLLMLASAPVFAGSFLLTKVLTRSERAGVIVLWQAISVTLFSLPAAVWAWQTPSAWQWLGFVCCGVLGSAGHYCLTRSFSVADISSTQSVKFLDLVWSSLLGWAMFADVPAATTLFGGAVICAATLWVARREHHRGPVAPEPAR